MRKDQIFPSKYLKEPDLKGRDVTVMIDRTEYVTLNGKPSLIVYFRDQTKGLVVNTTIFDQIVQATSQHDSDDWNGHKITLFPTTTDFQGKTMPVVRVRNKTAKNGGRAPQAPPPDVDPDEEDEEIDF